MTEGGVMPESTDFATAAEVGNAWRPLNAAEVTRAGHWLEVASRRIRRRWPDVDARILLPVTAPEYLDKLDVRDVVLALVVEVLGGPPVPNATSFSVTSGAESRSVTLSSAAPFDPALFAPWMVAVFEDAPEPGPLPQFGFPKRDEPIREWRED